MAGKRSKKIAIEKARTAKLSKGGFVILLSGLLILVATIVMATYMPRVVPAVVHLFTAMAGFVLLMLGLGRLSYRFED